mmetsp:Transcript_34086/g.90881  ORF Transcript_34086/g.90881 Transcript_34086/m.90881 type:complete len:201 (-) Transcript_34086:53-655(-)
MGHIRQWNILELATDLSPIRLGFVFDLALTFLTSRRRLYLDILFVLRLTPLFLALGFEFCLALAFLDFRRRFSLDLLGVGMLVELLTVNQHLLFLKTCLKLHVTQTCDSGSLLIRIVGCLRRCLKSELLTFRAGPVEGEDGPVPAPSHLRPGDVTSRCVLKRASTAIGGHASRDRRCGVSLSHLHNTCPGYNNDKHMNVA